MWRGTLGIYLGAAPVNGKAVAMLDVGRGIDATQVGLGVGR